MDVHVRGPVTIGLRRRSVDVLTAREDGTDRFDDPDLLDRAFVLRRVLFTQDDDLLMEAAQRQRSGRAFRSDLRASAERNCAANHRRPRTNCQSV
jgi:hypothetical protein